jgi:hypothetical protein
MQEALEEASEDGCLTKSRDAALLDAGVGTWWCRRRRSRGWSSSSPSTFGLQFRLLEPSHPPGLLSISILFLFCEYYSVPFQFLGQHFLDPSVLLFPDCDSEQIRFVVATFSLQFI